MRFSDMRGMTAKSSLYPARSPIMKLTHFAFAALSTFAASVAAAQSCTPISSIPANLTIPGRYCLTQSFNSSLASGAALSVNAANVQIDLQGFTLDNSAAGSTSTAAGVFHNSQLAGFELTNGTIRGFNMALNAAVFASNPNAITLQDLRIESSRAIGAVVVGDHSIVRRVTVNRVVPQGAQTGAAGIVGNGNRIRFIDNDISDVAESTAGIGSGISCASCTGAVYEQNRITGGAGLGTFRGIFAGPNSIVRRNAVNNADEGIRMSGTGSKYQDNMTTQVTTAFIGGTDAGGNN
jgi:hypothetical protein